MKKILLRAAILLVFAGGFILWKYLNRNYHPPIPDVQMTILKASFNDSTSKKIIAEKANAIEGVTACAANSQGLVCITHKQTLTSAQLIKTLIENTGIALNMQEFKSEGKESKCPVHRFANLFDF